MKKIYISPELYILYDVTEPTLAGGSHDIDTKDNNDLNGGGTFGDENLGIDYGENWPGGYLNDGDLDD